ncbi:MAG: hypothetical protein ACE5HQ_07180 [Gemmatimonadota bacterium]
MKPSRARILIEGLVAGFLGYAAIALFYGVVNLASGRSAWYTARLLGQTLVGHGPEHVVPAAAPVLAFNAVHLVVFLAIGLSAAWLIFEMEHHPQFWFFLFFAALAGFMFSESAFLLLAEPTTAQLPWWSVVSANLAAGLAMGGYLYARHPRLLRELSDIPA